MARIVEDSDGEFPDVKDLVKFSRIDGGAGRRTGVVGKDDQKGSRERRAGTEPGKPNRRPKKRVLNKMTDNPLLRPLTSKAPRDASMQSGEVGEIQDCRTAKEAKAKNLKEPKIRDQPNSTRRVLGAEGEQDCKQVQDGRARAVSRKKVQSDEWDSESDDPVKDEFDDEGLSDFIVDDSTCLDEDSLVQMRPPKSGRRLVRGRRKAGSDDENDENGDLELKMNRLAVVDDADIFSKKERVVDRKNRAKEKSFAQSSDIEDPFTLRFSPSQYKPRKVSKETRFTTPPGTPELKPKGLKSPTKKLPGIPMTPHRPSMDAFWQQDIINDWNDEYSPRKTPRPTQRLGEDGITLGSPKKGPVKVDKAVKAAKKTFMEKKHALAETFLAELDSKITNGEVVKLAASTGGIKVIWSKKLNTTAGRANWKRETIKSNVRLPDGTLPAPTYRHHASIELAEKVIDDEDRLLNVLAHEFCHLANFMISNIKTNPHGKEFKAWAAKCSRQFGHRGIEVTTKHSYSIDYKYVWECENCGLEFKRHSKSIDPTKHTCGKCKSKLVQTKPVPRANAGSGKVSEYQIFVKENMKKVREENPGSPQKDIMGLVGKKYQEYKAMKMGGTNLESINIEENVGSKEGTRVGEENTMEFIARKLDFFDLTSP